MTYTLEEIAQIAREHQISPAERRAQRHSMISGLRPHNSTLSSADVSNILDRLEGAKAPSTEKEVKETA